MSDDARKLLKILSEEHQTSELMYRQAFHHHRESALKLMRAYYEKNQVDAILYPTIPILPCRLEDYKESSRWRVPHNGE
jgi:Asp-tRNA(Asn)/Glu-tRNA(Gln) amidotransferase A subunit family amidase